MALRDETYNKFGPLLLEALFDTILDELNMLRAEHGLPARTKDYFLGRSNNNQSHLEEYNWMQEET